MAACGVPPERLTTVRAQRAACNTRHRRRPDAQSNRVRRERDLIEFVVSGKRLDEAIADAANAQRVAEYSAGLQQRIELPVIKQFAQELKNGDGEEINDRLRGDFDAAAAALAKIKERDEPGAYD